MGSKHHTVIFVPHERAEFRKWRVTSRQLGVIGSVCGLILIAGLVSLVLFLRNSVQRGELGRLANENAKLHEVNQAFEGRLEQLRGKLGEYEERTRKLAIVAGLQSLGGASEGGVGGRNVESNSGLAGAFANAEQRTGALATHLQKVEGELEKNLGLVSSTPAIWPVRGIVTSSFGTRRDPITGETAFHSGIDISALPGRPVKASGAGVVTQTEQYGPLGRVVYIAHGFGLTSVYGHLSRIEVAPGQRVERGDLVGLVGNTGRATGYHLHYEVQVQGKPVEPLNFIVDSAASQF